VVLYVPMYKTMCITTVPPTSVQRHFDNQSLIQRMEVGDIYTKVLYLQLENQ